MVPGILEMYLQDPLLVFSRSFMGYHYEDPWCYSDLPADVFETRLATALNTFIRSSYNFSILTGADGPTLRDRAAIWSNGTAAWSEFTESVYLVNWTWFAIYLLSTLALAICAITNIVLRSSIRAPDFLTSVVALTRDTPFVAVSAGGSYLGAADQLKRLKGKRVQIRDIQPQEEVGKIAFSDAADSSRLDWDRKYD